jgi:hypothetical protein
LKFLTSNRFKRMLRASLLVYMPSQRWLDELKGHQNRVGTSKSPEIKLGSQRRIHTVCSCPIAIRDESAFWH